MFDKTRGGTEAPGIQGIRIVFEEYYRNEIEPVLNSVLEENKKKVEKLEKRVIELEKYGLTNLVTRGIVETQNMRNHLDFEIGLLKQELKDKLK